MNTSGRLQRISVSQTLEMSNRSAELKAKGIDIIDLSIGQPDFQTPSHIKQAAINAIKENYTFYTPVAGYKSLRQAIVDKLKRENNLDYTIDQIVVSNGAKQSLANAVLTLVDEGDEILITAPYWVSYAEIDNLANGKNVIIKTTIENDYKALPEEIEAAITPRTKVLIYSSPSNPAGSVYSKEELHAIAKIVEKHKNLYVISDEIYEHINYIGEHESIAQFDFIKDRVILINGMSKGYAMTGWRIGYMAAPNWIAKSCMKLQGQYTSNASSISQMASIAALNGDMVYTLGMNATFKKRRDVILQHLSEIPDIKVNIPEGAFYVFPEVKEYFGKIDGYISIKNASDLSMYLLNEAHVATVPGSAFGMPECIRFSYAAHTSKIEEAMERIKEALIRLKKQIED